jgi:hypothetical protein
MANDNLTSPKARVRVAAPPRRPRTPWWWLIPIVTILPYLLIKLHYQLPEPLPPM